MNEPQKSGNLNLSDYFRYGQWRGAAETISGVGSTVAYTQPLRQSLPKLLGELKIKRLLDAPCGDFNWMKELDLGDIHYTGLDIVERIVEENITKFANSRRQFFKRDITRDALPNADLIMVRDCLFHLPFTSIADFFENYLRSNIEYVLLTNNANLKNVNLAVPGQYRPVNFLLPPFEFPQPSAGRKLRDYPDGQPERYMYLWTRDQLVEVLTPRKISELRNFPPPAPKPAPPKTATATEPAISPHLVLMERARHANSHLPTYFEASKYPGTLSEIIRLSFDRLGFFTRHPPRAFEYPWIVEHIPKTSGLVIDLGAGLSPVPFLLAERGAKVLTVDYSDMVRNVANKARWNEWGFLDYSQIDGRIESRNVDFSKLPIPQGCADVVYSVSVIEHMPAAIRRDVALTAARALRPGGLMVLTLDLMPRAYQLWNRDRGKVVESAQEHGTLNDFIHELWQAGIALNSLSIERALPGSGVDIACLTARKLAIG